MGQSTDVRVLHGARLVAPLTVGGRALRVGLLVLVWSVWVVVATAYLELSGVAGETGAWRWSAVAFVPLAVPTWFLCRRMVRRRVIFLGATALIALLVWGIPAQATPSFGRVTTVADQWGTLSDGQLLGHAWEGNEWCFSDGCPAVVRYYAVPDAAVTVHAVSLRLETDGWRRHALAHGPAYCKGDFQIGVRRLDAADLTFVADVRRPPVGQEVVGLRVGANCL
ncbi:hypothetical protein [Pedococcus bigeumensis]|uniref:hypothetical protein n=1 Tax=Pedococcus bigeumensis TaxID=433644 RepID=UPI00112EE754|nr:hypothetical protein [Pedococcus bigeumensis]